MNYSDADWKYLCGVAADAFLMDEEQRASFLSSKAAKLIAALPRISGTRNPDRIALAHVGTFVLATYGESRLLFDHRHSDDGDPLERLAPIADHPGGDPAIVKAGLARLALIMLAGYERDMEKDAREGFYNPLVVGTWNPEAVRSTLLAMADSVACPELDAVITSKEALKDWWSL